MLEISPELAEILGLLCAEGSHIIECSDYLESYRGRKRFRRNKKSERIEFYNKDKRLVNHYQTLLLNEFDYPTKITRFGKINIGNHSIVHSILESVDIGNLSWKVPISVINSDVYTKQAFVRGFFDGDGTASKSIRFFSTNLLGLKGVHVLLTDMRFSSYFIKPQLKPKRKPLYALRIPNSEKERFLNTIKPILKRPGNVGVNIKL